MSFRGMLKWAVGKDDRPTNPTKSLKKRRKQIDMQRDAQVGLISGCCKHRSNNNPSGSSRILHKNRVRVSSVGVINNNLNNESDNGKLNGHNYKVPDQTRSPRLPHYTPPPAPVDDTSLNNKAKTIPYHHNNNNNSNTNADSKSLLYMSLDHLPMAIVKQYERMLQDDSLKPPPPPPPKSVLKSSQHGSNCGRNSDENQPNRPPIVNHSKAKSSKLSSVVMPLSNSKPHSKSITFKNEVDTGKRSPISSSSTTARKHANVSKKSPPCSTPPVPVLHSSKIHEITIKEAHSRSLKVLHGLSSSKKNPTTGKTKNAKTKEERKNKTPPPEEEEEEACKQKSSFRLSTTEAEMMKKKKKELKRKERGPEDDAKKPRSIICDKGQIIQSAAAKVKSFATNANHNSINLTSHNACREKKPSTIISISTSAKPATSSPHSSSSTSSSSQLNKKKLIKIPACDENDPNTNPSMADQRPAAVGERGSQSSSKTSGGELNIIKNQNSSNLTGLTSRKKDAADKKQESGGSDGTQDSPDTNDLQFLEKPITYSTPPVTRSAKKLTLKRSELKKLERLKNQTEKLNRFLRKYNYLPNPQEEEGQSPEEKSIHVLYQNVHRSYEYRNRFPYSNPTNDGNNKFGSIQSPHFTAAKQVLQDLSLEDYSTSWENMINSSLSSPINSYTKMSELAPSVLPIIQEDSAEMSSSTTTSGADSFATFFHNSCHIQCQGKTNGDRETGRGDAVMNDSFLMSQANRDSSPIVVQLNQSLQSHDDDEKDEELCEERQPQRDRVSDLQVNENEGEGGNGGGVFGMKKLKAPFSEPLGDLFDEPTSLGEDEGFMSPSPPEAYSPASSSSTSTFNRFSVSSTQEHEHFRDDYDKEESNRTSSSSSSVSSSTKNQRTCSCSSSSAYTDQEEEVTSEEGGGGPNYIILELKDDNANYHPPANPPNPTRADRNQNHDDAEVYNNLNETWNSHSHHYYAHTNLGTNNNNEIASLAATTASSPCGTGPSEEDSHRSSSSGHTNSSSSHAHIPLKSHHHEDGNLLDLDAGGRQSCNKRENELDEASFICNRLALAFSTPSRRRRNPLTPTPTPLRRFKKRFRNSKAKTPSTTITPRKVVRRPPVINSCFSGKGELLIETYRNGGDYVTVHVVQARRLEALYHSSWRLCIKVSLLPDAEAATRSSDAIIVNKSRTWVKIGQKFSFEVPTLSGEKKVFLTAVKKWGKHTTFLGWASLAIGYNEEKTQTWLKLRKRKMSTTATTIQSCNSTFSGGGKGKHQPPRQEKRPSIVKEIELPSPPPCNVDNGGSSSSSRCDYELDPNMPKSQLQNSSTMDSGVEDCCEPPPPPAPSIDLDDKNGQRVIIKMKKLDTEGYGFSVVWVSPPRIERLEKGKTAEVAGLRIGDLIIGVNGEDVTTAPNTTIYTKMKTTGNDMEMEVWRTSPPIQSRSTHHHHPALPFPSAEIAVTAKKSSTLTVVENHTPRPLPNINEVRSTTITKEVTVNVHQLREQPQPNSSCTSCPPAAATATSKATPPSNNNINQNVNLAASSHMSHPPPKTQSHPPPTSILKPPPPAPPAVVPNSTSSSQQQQNQGGSSSWKIRFNIELLDNEDDCLKQFFICELKFFRKVVAALDRYLIPAQSNYLLTHSEINSIFSNVIKVITVTKRILNCVVKGSTCPGWKFQRVLLSTHSDHLSEMASAYTNHARTLGYASMLLSDKMSLQEFAKFVLETPVPKGHLDMTSLLFAPLEHLRNICEVCEEVSRNNDEWMTLFTQLKALYADIVSETDFMEPISHVSMKKHPLLSVRDLEKRVVSTSCQPVKVCEKGRRWLFGSRLYKKESDGSWSPVWAFLFTDIIVLTSHTTRDRVFFVKEAPIRLEDVVTLHFNLPKKHDNEFRLLFEPEPVHTSRFDKLLPIHRSKKASQIALRASNIQLKSMWKLLLQRQIITLNTRLSKSASSNFSISEFCEKFPITPQHCEEDKDDHNPHIKLPKEGSSSMSNSIRGNSSAQGGSKATNESVCDNRNQNCSADEGSRKDTRSSQVKPQLKPYVPDGLNSLSKELLRSRVTRATTDRKGIKVESIAEEIKVTGKSVQDHDFVDQKPNGNTGSSSVTLTNVNATPLPKTAKIIEKSEPPTKSNSRKGSGDSTLVTVTVEKSPCPSAIKTSATTKSEIKPSQSAINNNNNNEITDFNRSSRFEEACPCVETIKKKVEEKVHLTGKLNDENSNTRCQGTSNRNDNEQMKSLKISNSSPSQSAPTLPKQRCPLIYSSSPYSSPSMTNKRVEALKQESGSPSSTVNQKQHGSKIITNATLKSRQQERMTQKEEGEMIITMVEKPPSDPSGSDADCILISQRIETTTVTTKDASSSPLLNAPRCQSENGFVKNRVHTDSPILSGYGSEKTRRRVLYDYKVQRDYPELFGITPKDRRTFIKQLAERPAANERSFIAPYYFSPLPTPKFSKKLEDSSTSTSATASPDLRPRSSADSKNGNATTMTNWSKEKTQLVSKFHEKVSTEIATSSSFSKPVPSTTIPSEKNVEARPKPMVVESEDETEENKSDPDLSLKEIARGILRNCNGGPSEDDTEEESDDSEGPDEEEVRAQVHRQRRSPEESSNSNDSGISDELNDKRKSNAKQNETFQSNVVAVNSTEVIFSSKLATTNSNLLHCDKPKKAHACITTPKPKQSQSTKIDHVCFEGEEEARMEAMVVLKADKCTGTDEDVLFQPKKFSYYNTEKSMRTLMAERREAFFASYNQQHPSSSSFSNNRQINHFRTTSTSIPKSKIPVLIDSPLKVKIVQGGTLQTTVPDVNHRPHQKSPPCERVLLTRFPEKERHAKMERIESSDESSSDNDFANRTENGTENGTTDPSWSSSSSLGGTSSAKEEASTSISTSAATSIYNSHHKKANGDIMYTLISSEEQIQAASLSSTTKVFMSDFTNGLPATSSNNTSNNNSTFSPYPLTLGIGNGPEIVITEESPETPTVRNGCSSEGEDNNESDSFSHVQKKGEQGLPKFVNGGGGGIGGASERKQGFLRVESNDSTVENFGDDDDYNFDEEEELSQCSAATINRYGTYESLEKIETEDSLAGLPDFARTMTRSKARFTFDDDDSDDDNDLFEEDFESDFNFRFPSQIQDNTYSVSRLGPLPPLLEEDYEDDNFDEEGPSSSMGPGPSSSLLVNGSTLRARHEAGLRHDNSFLLARLATMYARSSISPLKILRDLWLKKRYRQAQNWKYKE